MVDIMTDIIMDKTKQTPQHMQMQEGTNGSNANANVNSNDSPIDSSSGYQAQAEAQVEQRSVMDNRNSTANSEALLQGLHRFKDYHEVLEGYSPAKNKTYPIMTRFERAKILGLRTEQLARGADPMIEGDFSSLSPSDVAQMELDAKATPFIVVRNLPDGSQEMWKVRDLTILK